MERLINNENVYANIRNLLEKESDVDKITKRLIQYHFILKKPDMKNIKEEKADVFRDAINIYNKIGFYLLTRLVSFQYDEDVKQSGFSLAAFCFEIISKNGDLSKEEIEESKLLSSILYTLASNTANSIVMAREIESEHLLLYKLFLKRDFRKILNSKSFDDEIGIAVKKMAYSLVYNSTFDAELKMCEETMLKLKERESEHLYYFRLIIYAYKQMCENSIRKLLLSYPYLEKYINILTQKERIYELWESQKQVSRHMEEVFDINSVSYISLPTSSGKTLLAEMIIYNYISQKSNLQFYIVPSLALENEITRKLTNRFRKVGTLVTNSVKNNKQGDIILPQIIVATPERVDNILRKNIEIFKKIDCIIIDEFHKISNGTRGWFEEALTIWLNYMRETYKYKMVLISAIADNVNESLNTDIANVFEDEWAPTRKLFCKFQMNKEDSQVKVKSIKKGEIIKQRYDMVVKYPGGGDKYKIKDCFYQVTYGQKTVDGKDQKRSDKKVDLAWKAINVIKERPLMVFFLSKPELIRFVKKSNVYMDESEKTKQLSINLAQILGESHSLVRCLKYGVAYHDGDLPDDVRIIIENEFRKGTISILACTTTLADGVNLPAKAILLANVFIRLNKEEYRKLEIGDYKNIIGRIGRALEDTEGSIYLIDYPEYYYAEEDFENYYSGAEICYDLKSAIDFQIDLVEDSILASDDVESYKYMLNLQKLIFTLSLDWDDFDAFYEKFEKIQLLRISENKRQTMKGYGKKYFALAKSINTDFLNRNIKTGVSYNTNLILSEIANDLVDSTDVKEVITENIYIKLLNCVEFTPRNNKVQHYEIFISWINEERLKNIADIISPDSQDEKYEKATTYIKQVFQYIDPWMFSCLLEFLDNKRNAKQVVNLLREQVRYGTQDKDTIELCKSGIKSRDLAISIANIYHETEANESIINWLTYVQDRFLYERLVTMFDVSILEQIGNVRGDNKKKTSYFEKTNRIKCKVFLNDYQKIKSIVSMMKEEQLTLEHIKTDPINRFRVNLNCGFQPIGYLQDIVSEEVCELLDADEMLNCEYAEAENDTIWIFISRVTIEL